MWIMQPVPELPIIGAYVLHFQLNAEKSSTSRENDLSDSLQLHRHRLGMRICSQHAYSGNPS
jgi:hypothetical protein